MNKIGIIACSNGMGHISRSIKLGIYLSRYYTITIITNRKKFYKLNNFYIEEQRFEIEIIDGIDFKASKYFDISINRWNLDKLVPSVLEAHRRCKQIKNIDS